MDTVRTNRLRLTALVRDDSWSGGDAGDDVGVGISELTIDGLDAIRNQPDAQAETGVLCGFGPALLVDDREVQFGVRGTLDDVVSGRRLRLTNCDKRPIELPTGENRLKVRNVAGFAVSELVLRPRGDATATQGPAAGAERVEEWGTDRRTVEVRAVEESVLAVSESFNAGWEAQLEGRVLPAVVVDGWKQGWVVPSGAEGVVTMRYTPQRLYAMGLAGGAGLAVVLAAAAALLWRRRLAPASLSAGPPPAPQPGVRRTHGPWAPLRSSRQWPLSSAEAGAVGALAVFAILSVPLALGAAAGAGASALPRRFRRPLCWAGATALPAAVLMTLTPAGTPLSPPDLADVLTAFAVGFVVGLMRAPGAVRTYQRKGHDECRR
jgi:arabinofuranan 3-O-arabinosyltransferase